MQRGYVLLIKEWLAYMAHLKTSYPYLFSLALRTNPFDPFATPEIQWVGALGFGPGQDRIAPLAVP